ncbi:proline iminopeptidase-family hydrolase [Mucilaginibacter terrae]|uniref:Proline iminopeptidase n=1 Tax=Mucilaginibacter terrae TaxID=1955052 RepID=A0ABU3GRE7_9SPHI|nr:proline iminopeptidase-family hydrolase [Mucilaginibacter terrae]MDT3402342.1 proline iminopeptidase [Mucilaginibacter terrae]
MNKQNFKRSMGSDTTGTRRRSGKKMTKTFKGINLLCCCLLMTTVSTASCSKEADIAANGRNDYFKPDSGVQTGGAKLIPVKTAKGTFNVWTKRVGNNPKIKVLILSGGPGASSEYLECMDSFFPREGIEYIYYDQLATGRSDNPKDTALFDLGRSVEEVEQVRKALNLNADNFYLYGHSWGGIAAMEYALKYQQNLKALIVSDMMSSAADYNRYANDVLAKQINPDVLKEIRAIEAKGDFENPRYMELLVPHFYAKFICRIPVEQWPEPLNRAFGKINHDFYTIMQGPSEFGLRGKLTGWDIKAKLPGITVPVLTIGARYDTMDPDHMKWIASQVKHGSFLYCPNGSHMCFYDDQQVYFQGLIQFIKAIDSGKQALSFNSSSTKAH